MRAKPDINAFLAGGKADAAEQAEPARTPNAKPPKVPRVPKTKAPTPEVLDEPRITKTIRLARSLDVRLKEESFRRTMAGGKRIAESDLIEAALLQYFNK